MLLRNLRASNITARRFPKETIFFILHIVYTRNHFAMGIKKHLAWFVDKAAPYAKEALGTAATYAADKLIEAGVPAGAVEVALDTALEYIPKTDKYAKKAINAAVDMYGEYKHEAGSPPGYVEGAQPFVGLVRQPTMPSAMVSDGWSRIGAPFGVRPGAVVDTAKQAFEMHQAAKQPPPVNPGPARFRVRRKQTHSIDQAAALAKELTSTNQKKAAQVAKKQPTTRKAKKQKQKSKLAAAQEKHEKAERKLLKLIGEKASKEDLKKQKQKIAMAKADIKKASKKLDYL